MPALWQQQTFLDKGGPEIASQMYAFNDKKGRPICLVPEITGLIQDTWRESWSKGARGPRRVFYVARCYRYERPQKGRYREFTQVGVELLNGVAPGIELKSKRFCSRYSTSWAPSTNSPERCAAASVTTRRTASKRAHRSSARRSKSPVVGATRKASAGRSASIGCSWRSNS